MTPEEIFSIAFNKTLSHEGGYSNDPDDAGAETIFGVSRRYWPNWIGWVIVDRYKNRDGDLVDLNELCLNGDFNRAIELFYKQNFWDRFQGDKVALMDRNVALEMFDTAVNMGIGRAVTFLQQALNYLNRNNSLFKDLVEDGKLGPASIGGLHKIVNVLDIKALLKIMNVLQANHYLEYMRKNPVQEKFARGWLNRVAI